MEPYEMVTVARMTVYRVPHQTGVVFVRAKSAEAAEAKARVLQPTAGKAEVAWEEDKVEKEKDR
jgi:hypothetical protein